MGTFAKHWVQRLCLAGAGVLISSFGPDQVPAAYKPWLLYLGIAMALVAVVVWPLIDWALNRARYPERHGEVLREIASALAKLKGLAYSPGSWTRVDPSPWQIAHSQAYSTAKREADILIDQISYDASTYSACKDFIHLCSLVVGDQLHKWNDELRQNVADLDRMGADLFRYLHAGKSVDKRKVYMPQWMRDNDKRTQENAGTGKSASAV